MNNFDNISYYYSRVVLCFLMFDCHEYSRCCLLQLIHFHYWESNLPELYNFLTSNYSIFDEECGEISLSILASSTLSKPINTDVVSMSKYYLLQKFEKDSNQPSNYYKCDKIEVIDSLVRLFSKFTVYILLISWI